MIIGNKQKFYQRPPPAIEFDKFLKIRSQKQSIIQSDSQPISEKVQGFQQLLKLTKTGTSICSHLPYKRHLNSQLKNKSQSSKTINVVGGYTSGNTENDKIKFQDIQTDEAQLKKLNKMVFGITEWEQDKGKQSFHGDRKINYPKTSHDKKRFCNTGKNQKTSKQQIRQRKQQAYTSCDGKKFRKFYVPLRRHQAESQLNRINSQFIKTSAKLNYPPALLQCNFLEENSTHFKQLKNRIKVLQTKAINQYGLKFDPPNMLKVKKQHIWDDSKDNSQEKQNQELSFSDLELAPILAKQFPNRYKSYNNNIGRHEDTINDASIPKSLIDIVQSRGQSFHHFSFGSNNNVSNPQLCSNKSKMKKGHLYRPKTFKPTYTYIKI